MLTQDDLQRAINNGKIGAAPVAKGHTDIIENAGIETAMRRLEYDEQGRSISSPDAWERTVGRRSALHEIRKESKLVEMTPAISESLIEESHEGKVIDLMCPPRIDRASAAETMHALRALHAATLTFIRGHRHYEIFTLHYDQKLYFAEIALVLGITESAARKRWFRMIGDMLGHIQASVKHDPALAIFSAIIDDMDQLHNIVFELLDIVIENGGFHTIEITAHMILAS